MKKLATLAAMAALMSTTALAQQFPPEVQSAIDELAAQGFREVRVERGPFGTRVKGEGGGIEREILIQFGVVVSDRTERDDDDDDDHRGSGYDDNDDDDDSDDDDDDDNDDDDDDDSRSGGSRDDNDDDDDDGSSSSSGSRDDNDDDNDDDGN